VTSGEEADETGIVVAGKDQNGHGYVLADISGRYPPHEWARLAIAAYRTHRADRIVAEVNNGGDMVGATLRMVDPNVAFTAVRASRGKILRAEPVAALYQQGRVHHIGTFPQLEDQMTPEERQQGPEVDPAESRMATPLLLAQHGERADDDADNAKWDMDTCDYCQEDRIGGWDLDPG
jgi:phage terminase large subunit-like protein